MDARRIVVGIDGSDVSREALLWARSEADATGAELVAVTAWSPPNASYPTYGGYVPMRVPLDLPGQRRVEAEAFVKEVVGDAGVRVEVLRGHPANVLVEAARDADLLVVGSRGHGELVGTLLGSVSRKVAVHATCPVVVVRHRAAA